MKVDARIFWLLIAGLIITAIGLITGMYFFLFLILPLGLFVKRKNEDG